MDNNMQNEKTKSVQMDELCKAGAIISIISSIILMLSLITLGLFLIIFDFSSIIEDEQQQFHDALELLSKIKIGMGIFVIIISLIQLLTLIFCIRLLQGKAKSNIAAGVFGLFSGVLGGILILVGKYQVKNSDSDNNYQ